MSAPIPKPPKRQYSFTDFQVSNPPAPPPGDRLDGEYDRINRAIADIIAWVSSIEKPVAPSAKTTAAPTPRDHGDSFIIAGADPTATALDWAEVSFEWAEHMPDTIPPNILATMGITGDHWSARWWAHRALEIVTEKVTGGAVVFVGPNPPLDPIAGSLWWDNVGGQLYVWYVDLSSSQWVPATNQPVSASEAAEGPAGTVATLAELADVIVPGTSARVQIQKYDSSSLAAPAWYERVVSNPGVPLAAQDATGSWFKFCEDPATPEMAGAHGNNTGNDAPAFSRLLQSGDRAIVGKSGAVYRIAREGTTRKSMHNNGIAFNNITLDMTDTKVVMSADAGVDDYATYLDCTGDWKRFTLIGGTWTMSTRPYLQGVVTVKGTGSTPADAWFEFRRDPHLPHPGWANQTVRIVDQYFSDTREFRYRVAGNSSSDVTGSGEKSGPGFPLTRPNPTGTPDIYRVDMSGAQTSIDGRPLPTPIELRNLVTVGNVIGVQHRRDTARGMGFSRSAQDANSFLTMRDVVIHACDTVGIRPYSVSGGQITRLRVVPENELDVYSTSAGGFRLQDCRGTWSFDNCWINSSGDDAFFSVATSQMIKQTPTTDVTLTSKQLRCVSPLPSPKPLVGDILQFRDWEHGIIDETNTWTAVSVGAGTGHGSPYLLELDHDVNPAWTPTGTVTVTVPPDDGDPDGSEVIVGDGTGWVFDTTAAPVIITSGCGARRNRGAGWLVTHVGAGSQINLDWASDNATASVIVGDHYPASLNGMAPRNVDVHVGVISGGKTFSGVMVGGYKGTTRDESATEGFVRNVNVVIDAVRDSPRGFVEFRGASNCDVAVGSGINFALNPNEENPRTFRAIYGTNTANSRFDGGAIAALSRWDVLFDGASHDNVIVSPARARNWLDNSEFRQIARGTSVTGTTPQVATFDRWQAVRALGSWTVSRRAGFGRDEYCMRVQRTAGDTQTANLAIGQQLPGSYVRQLRGRKLVAYCRVRGGVNLVTSGAGIRCSFTTGTVFNQVWDMSNTTTGGLTGGAVTAADPLPAILAGLNGTSVVADGVTAFDFVTRPFLVPETAAVVGVKINWFPPASTAGAADYLELGAIALVVQGAGYTALLDPEEARVLTGQVTFDPPSLLAATGVTTAVIVEGVVLGDLVEAISFSRDLQGIVLTGYVSFPDAVDVRFHNGTGGTIDLASGTLRVRVRRA